MFPKLYVLLSQSDFMCSREKANVGVDSDVTVASDCIDSLDLRKDLPRNHSLFISLHKLGPG